MKTCSRCKLSKAVDDFSLSTKAKDGRQAHCRKCKSELHQLHHARRMQSIRSSKFSRVERNRRWGLEYLREHPCSCGESDPRLLEWDHDDPTYKRLEVSRMILYGYSLAELEAEAAKCTVRCVKCHRLRTISQFDFWIGRQAPVA